MWTEFFRFDLRYQLRQPLLWIVALALMLTAGLSAGSDAFRIGGAIGNAHLNAPLLIARQLGILSVAAMFLVTVFIAGAVLRDSDAGIADLLFATPMCKIDYLVGRFLAGLCACVVIFALVTAAMMAGASLSGADPARLSPFALAPYAWSFFVLVLPNLLFVAALLMLLATVTRSMLMVYVGVLAFMVLWSAAGFLAQRQDNVVFAALLDPFALRALALATRYFTSADTNTRLPELTGALLANRAVWSMVALGMLAATIALFKPQRAGTGRQSALARHAAGLRQAVARALVRPQATPSSARHTRRIAPRFTSTTGWAQCWSMLCLDTRGILRSMPFVVMLLLGVANFLVNYLVGGMRFDSTPYPLTRLMLQELDGGLNFVLTLVLLFYSGELVFKDRQARIDAVADALPVPNWAPLLAKCGALVAVVLAFVFTGVPVAMVIQAIKGGVPFEPLLYLQGTLIAAVWYVLMAVALLVLQTVAANKYAGYALGIALMASGRVLQGLDIDHHLASYASLPTLVYSDMNGYGHYLAGWSWFALYWSLFACALVLVAQAFWARGLPPAWRQRAVRAIGALRGKTGAALVLCMAACAACGGWIYYNTNVLNPYLSASAQLDLRADYEKAWRGTMSLPHPHIISVKTYVDIFPEQQRVEIRGHYVLQNKTAQPLDTLHIQRSLGPEAGAVSRVDTAITGLPAHTVARDDPRFGIQLIKLAQPLAPGATLPLDFTVRVSHPGFTNHGKPSPINENGTLFTFDEYFPQFGYNQSLEIEDRNERRARGLGEPNRLPSLDDKAAQRNNFWKLYGIHGDLVDFEATMSTSADQIAMAPGTLQRSWEDKGRRYFHYKLDQPVLPFFSFQSARWEVKQTEWHGIPIRVYYDRKHPYNVDSMIAGAKGALEYFTANFGPYPHKEVRILETPLYLSYARSFPTVIPFSESLGFINDLRGEDKVDHVFYVTAHEIAHQWWGDQVIAANVQGSAMVTESLAEYASLMATEHHVGKEKLRSILRWDLDEYLRGRGAEQMEEQPLMRVEGQVYVQYRKGSLALYRLKEEIGEASVNRALKRLLDEKRYQTSPYVTSRDVLQYLRAETPSDKQQLVTDLFERIVVYDNRVQAASAVQRKDGKWEVSIQVSLAKLVADGKGVEKPVAYDEPVEIGVLAEGTGRLLYRERHVLAGGLSRVTVVVDGEPADVVVDPSGLLIDRNVADNRRKVEVSGAGL
ncbi:M1 family metallopeptidase [Pseudoduganella ginsengisoli]|uniref:Peptidase M1 membrane alanine aminopeptidase domain-containing protein n=1 Tax=Pseudoduganella ginsengisoli TaxID=1462440 RepID=A0A6L6Q6Z9_9BURK|nr:M1 family aminopeptidase [Pseudoduganella ginsengisoli]MTW05623.1 hypothetical protein [Pseudoduganella ginsengisoli]